MTKYEYRNMVYNAVHLLIDAFISGCLLIFLLSGIAINKGSDVQYISTYKLITIFALCVITGVLAIINCVSIINRSKRVKEYYENSKSSRIQDIQSKGQERED